MTVTLETSHVPITPYGLPVLSLLAANIGHDPSPVSERHASTAVFRAVLSAGVKNLQRDDVQQIFVDDVQNKPLEAAVQTLVPQAQLSELTELPSTTEHDA